MQVPPGCKRCDSRRQNLFDPAQETQSIVLIRAVNVFFSSEQQEQGIYIFPFVHFTFIAYHICKFAMVASSVGYFWSMISSTLTVRSLPPSKSHPISGADGRAD